jgi:hypothetical protein
LHAFLLLGATALAAQDSPVPVGARVRARVQSEDGNRRHARAVQGIVVSGDSAGIALSTEADEHLALPFSTLTRLQQSGGRRSRGAGALRGAGLGFLFGGLGGGVVGYASGDDDPGCWFCLTAKENAVLLGVALGTVGAVVGTAVGATRPGERWRKVPLAGRLEVAPRGSGLALGVRIPARRTSSGR